MAQAAYGNQVSLLRLLSQMTLTNKVKSAKSFLELDFSLLRTEDQFRRAYAGWMDCAQLLGYDRECRAALDLMLKGLRQYNDKSSAWSDTYRSLEQTWEKMIDLYKRNAGRAPDLALPIFNEMTKRIREAYKGA